ncbi:hypothetical protein D0Z00_002375 [Geotrichum galactomycetum]|uniref:Uncharacterized protein n=1 Tax=Geotrichum galactomycetum TaxID=27317 RepID=A0ACB6V4E9_9ASCO|nr:hypothetical protein D0Z00_002375 [Geotrichum candidum]
MAINHSFEPLRITIPHSESGTNWFAELDQQQPQSSQALLPQALQPSLQQQQQQQLQETNLQHAQNYLPSTQQQLNNNSVTTTGLEIPPQPSHARPPLPSVAPLSPRTPRSTYPLSSASSFDSHPSPSTSLLQQALFSDRPPPIPPKSPERGSPSSSPYLHGLSKNHRIISTASPSSSFLRLQKLIEVEPGLAGALDRWVTCFAIVRFDVDIGPDLKIIQPATVALSDADYKLISFSSLPERSINTVEAKAQFHAFTFESTTFANTTLHGFALFSQQRNYRSPRGYDQESLVIISKLNYPQVFNACLQLTQSTIDHELGVSSPISRNSLGVVQAPDSIKVSIIQTAIRNITKWPSPEPNSTIKLPLLGTTIHLSIPLYQAQPLLGITDLDTSSVYFHSANAKNGSADATASMTATADNLRLPTDPHSSIPVITATEPASNWDYMLNFVSDISDLYLLYEYMLLVKPIVVYASSPHQCSTFISLLVDLIRPIPYSGRVREYVTIHSCNPGDLDAEGITGVTNPFLVKGITNPDTLVFVLSPVPGSSGRMLYDRPVVEYYRDLQVDSSVVLGRRLNSGLKQAHNNTLPFKHTKATAQHQPPLSSWGSRLFSALSSKSDTRKVKKTKISSPLSSTFVKLPLGVQLDGLKPSPVAVSNDVEEEIRIKQLMKQSRKEIVKHRLFFPDQKFIASLHKYLDTVNAAIPSNGGLVRLVDANGELPVTASHSADFAVKFHFSTVTAKFLSPLGCYLDPVKGGLAFSRTDFIRDLKRSSIHTSSSSSQNYEDHGITSIKADNKNSINKIDEAEGSIVANTVTSEPSRQSLLNRPRRRESIRNMKRRSMIVTSSSSTHVPLLDTTSGLGRRSSMLETSNLGINFGGPGIGLYPVTSSSAAATNHSSNANGTTGGNVSINASRKVSEAVHEIQKQLVYRTFLDTCNFRGWLEMNNVKALHA